MKQVKKLIEVALPLEEINAAAKREKSIRHGHPSTLHLWWARRPLAAARAVIWSSLVDDPSSHPELFPTEDAQNKERNRLFEILKQLVIWENSNNEKVLDAAKAEIHKSMGDDLPEFLDPFAGGGAIPLEAQRLGLKAHAHDLNPVAVMINKAMIEIPPKFAGCAPVNPKSNSATIKPGSYKGATALAEDVAYYGNWMKEEAFKRIGHLYPKATLPDGSEATVIAWIWARTVKCPNPNCGCQMPLVASWELSKKKGKEAYIEPHFCDDHFEYEIKQGKCDLAGTVERTGAKCLHCNAPVSFDYIRDEAKQNRMSAEMMAIVAEGSKGRDYLSPDKLQINISQVSIPEDTPETYLPEKALGFRVQVYGMLKHKDLFTPRQLTALTTFSDLVGEAYEKVREDMMRGFRIQDLGFSAVTPPEKSVPIYNKLNQNLNSSQQNPNSLNSNQLNPNQLAFIDEYAKAVVTYLAFVVDKLADYHSTICIWHQTGEKIANTMRRQAIPMTWDFVEGNPLCKSSGCINNMVEWVQKTLTHLVINNNSVSITHDAQTDCGLRNLMISTDPPYYDNIGYADLSDYFYVWMRRSLRKFYPDIFRTMLVPKAEELVATPYRFEGSKEKAKAFFEDGMFHTCEQLYQYSREDVPVTVYYAYKQSDTKESKDSKSTSSTGWETMLSAIIRAGFVITGTWPMDTELTTALKGEMNALASSIVLVCRKRDADAPACSWRDFQKALSRELRPALEKMQASSIAPVDLAQSAIGPGMAVYSRYSEVLKADDSPVTIREALELINKEIDKVFNEQDQNLDAETRFCLTVFEQYAFNDMKFGEANTLANARNTSVERVANLGAIHSEKGVIHLLPLDELPAFHQSHAECVWSLTHQLVRAIMKDGITGCAELVGQLNSTANLVKCKELSYRLYTMCERSNRANLAIGYNTLVTSWDDVMKRVSEQKTGGTQRDLF